MLMLKYCKWINYVKINIEISKLVIIYKYKIDIVEDVL